jgi:DNA-binding transcriptional MerR regulator
MSFSFREWYELNGKRLNAQRKSRYHTDPEYRARVLRTNQESRAKHKEETQAERREERKAIKLRPQEKRFKTVSAEVDGVTETLFTIGALAKALGCSIQAIRLWERQGVIPPTPLRTGKGASGDRLYTEAMVSEIRTILLAQGRLRNQAVKEKPKDRALLRYIRLDNGTVKQVPLYLIGVLAKHVHRNVVTLEQLESKGSLPRTPFRVSSVGRRLYTGAMIQAVKQAFESRDGEIRGEAAWRAFYNDVLAQWTAQGVMQAVLVEAPQEARNEPASEGAQD